MTGTSRDNVFVAGEGAITGWRAGSGPPVVILHGGPGLSDYTASLAYELADRYTVYRYQQRGVAPSTIEGPFTVATHLSDLVSVLDAVAAGGRAFVIGHSWGGYLALQAAAVHPERMLGLVVVDPLGVVGDGGESDMEHNMTERISPDARARAAELRERAMRGDGRTGDAMEAFAIIWPAYFSNPAQAPPMPPMQLSLPCYSETWESIHAETARKDLPGRLGRFDAPTAFVMGADSPLPPRHGELSAALIPGATTEVLDGCGHFCWLERPGSVRAALDTVRAARLSDDSRDP